MSTLNPTPPSKHECLIAVLEAGESVLISSSPGLYEYAIIEKFDFDLMEIISKEKWNTIPEEVGVYKCIIVVNVSTSGYYDSLEHDLDVWIENPVKVEIN